MINFDNYTFYTLFDGKLSLSEIIELQIIQEKYNPDYDIVKNLYDFLLVYRRNAYVSHFYFSIVEYESHNCLALKYTLNNNELKILFLKESMIVEIFDKKNATYKYDYLFKALPDLYSIGFCTYVNN